MFSSRSFQSDIKALESFHRYPDGKNEYGSPVITMSPENFIEKYPDLFDDKTDPARLPKTASGIAALAANAALGAKKSITRDKMASKGMKAFTEDDPELRDLFNPNEYSTLEKDPETGDEVQLFLQDPAQFAKFVKHVGLFVTKYVDHLVGERIDQLKFDVDGDMQTRLDQLETSMSSQIEDYIGKEAPKLMQKTSQEDTVKKIFNHYGNQVLSNNNYQNEVFTHLAALDSEQLKQLYSNWEAKTLTKFNQWQLNKPDSISLSPELVKALVDSSLTEILGEQGKFLLEPLPSVNLNEKIPVYNTEPTPPEPTAPVIQPTTAVPQITMAQPPEVIMGQPNQNQPQFNAPRAVNNLPTIGADENPLRNKLLTVIQNGKLNS